MKCEKCGKDSNAVYLTSDFKNICIECRKEERSKDPRTYWEKIQERMRKRYAYRR